MENNIYQIAYDIDDEVSSSSLSGGGGGKKMGSDNTIDSSTESDIVTKWVDHELRKIKRNLSKEIAYKESSQAGTLKLHCVVRQLPCL